MSSVKRAVDLPFPHVMISKKDSRVLVSHTAVVQVWSSSLVCNRIRGNHMLKKEGTAVQYVFHKREKNPNEKDIRCDTRSTSYY